MRNYREFVHVRVEEIRHGDIIKPTRTRERMVAEVLGPYEDGSYVVLCTDGGVTGQTALAPKPAGDTWPVERWVDE